MAISNVQMANASPSVPHSAFVPILLRGEAAPIDAWLAKFTTRRLVIAIAVVVAGSALFGAAVGFWRAPLQAAYNAIKFPLVILAVTSGNALLNGMLAPLLGLNLSFRQAFLAILMSFTIAAAILGAFSPLVLFTIWNTPPLTVQSTAYPFLLLMLVLVIAFAGIAANVRLLQVLKARAPQPAVAIRVLFAWLIGNLFFGSQLCWIFRPFIGSPGLPVQFIRPDALRGDFFETVFWALKSFLQIN